MEKHFSILFMLSSPSANKWPVTARGDAISEISAQVELQMYKPRATAAQSVVLRCIQASLAEIGFLPNQSVCAQKIYVSFYRTAIANMRYV